MFPGSPVLQTLLAVGVLALGCLAAFIAYRVAGLLLRRIAGKTATSLDDSVIGVLRLPVAVLFAGAGAFLALDALPYLSRLDPHLARAALAAGLAWGVWCLARVLDASLQWYGSSVARPNGTHAEMRLFLPLARRVATWLLLLVGLILVLDNLGVEISPLLAGLGITGLAVALALQPTLSNLFAGMYLATSKVLHAGDFVEMEGSARGYVIDVGWRCTRIRTPFNSVVVVPNSRLADSVLTNFMGDTPGFGVMVDGRVAYSSDLQRVRQVALEVAASVVADLPDADKSFEPWFGYERFGESNIDFWVWVQAKDRLSSFAMKTELILRLHQRFGKEGIEISYPVRKVLFPPDGSPAGNGAPART